MFFTPWNENQNFRQDLSIPWQPAPWQLDLWDARDSDPRHLLPGWRCPVISRWRICQVFIFSSLDSRNSVIWWNPFPALQCRLECEPGYVAQRTPLITCVNGEYAKGCHYLSLSHTRSHFPWIGFKFGQQIVPLAFPMPIIIPLSSLIISQSHIS